VWSECGCTFNVMCAGVQNAAACAGVQNAAAISHSATRDTGAHVGRLTDLALNHRAACSAQGSTRSPVQSLAQQALFPDHPLLLL